MARASTKYCRRASAIRTVLSSFPKISAIEVHDQHHEASHETGRTWGGTWAHLAAFAGRDGHVALGHVQAVDKKSIGILEKIYHDLGYRGTEAHIRARVMYYHQVGHYALGVHETHKQRVDLLPFYAKVITGKEN